ncbi:MULTISPECIES: DUF6879 family protein [Nocardiopsidaceae]|uniref:DUF6879 domain-containing protein n=1 Tax=Streptomonospora nanhaiensis TaxID=1323731 RepID=A0ABY6YHS1_9ACTN|nr:DUF6879 family protein [Streptomonospora nanhaiensis]WAE71731.1 hypothetical protein OUQ99_21165 [Streptomonospora nanhaiensis]
MLLDGDSWRKVFDGFGSEAWRLEVQSTYTMPGEVGSFSRFLRGEPKPEGHNSRWHERIRGYLADGKCVGRVRVVRRPLTDYQRYQFAWGIPGNIAAGEDIRILDLTGRDLGLPDFDFWMFDRERIVRLNYRPDGTQINRELVDEAPAEYQEWQRIAVEESIPFAAYVESQGGART